MKLNISIDPRKHPNHCGELLRGLFFAETVGGYTCCEWDKNVKPLPKEKVEFDDDLVYTCGQLTIDNHLVKCRWYWDGDGTLQFFFEDGSVLQNTDCKKDYVWKWFSAKKWKQEIELDDLSIY